MCQKCIDHRNRVAELTFRNSIAGKTIEALEKRISNITVAMDDVHVNLDIANRRIAELRGAVGILLADAGHKTAGLAMFDIDLNQELRLIREEEDRQAQQARLQAEFDKQKWGGQIREAWTAWPQTAIKQR